MRGLTETPSKAEALVGEDHIVGQKAGPAFEAGARHAAAGEELDEGRRAACGD